MQMPTHIVAVGGIVEDGKGNILLVKTHRGGWVYPGGQVEVGEDLVVALQREIQEESGIDALPTQLIGVYSNTGTYEGYNGVKLVPTKVMLDFVCDFHGGELQTSSDETSDSRWVPQDEVLDFITAPAIRLRYQAYLDFQGTVQYMAYVTKPDFDLTVQRFI